jgi:hypothetical protein
VALQNEEDVSNGNTRNLFSVSMGTTSSMHQKFPFRPQLVEMTPARAMAEPCADPNNLTTQLATILRESFSIEPKGWGLSIKNPTLITTNNSLTLEVIEFPSSQSLVGKMVKSH